KRLILRSPLLSPHKFHNLMHLNRPDFPTAHIDLTYDPAVGLRQAILDVCDKAEQAARAGSVLLFLSERLPRQGELVVHALLATAAVHHRLSITGLRCDTNLIVETGSARDSHQVACLIGYGATAVYPYLSYDIIDRLVNKKIVGLGSLEAHKNYRRGINKGLL